jgi:glycosyltransferase involved in cell wall biosynthesis
MKPSVLIIGNFLSSSGWTVSVCEELAQRLSASGWDVHTTSDKPARGRRLLDMVSTVVLRRSEYSVATVDVFSGSAFFWAEAVCEALHAVGRPYVLNLHGGSLPEFAQRWPRRVRRLLQSARAVVAPSGYLFEKMAPYRDSMILLPNALDLSRYTQRRRVRPGPCLLWARAFHEIYNPSLAARVVQLLAPAFPDVRLRMLGPDRGDGSRQRFVGVAAELGVSDRIEMLGGVPKSDVPHWMEKADIFLNTTGVDNTPVSVIEALACGMCVVSTNVGGLPFLLHDNENALLVPPADDRAMADAVGRILKEPGLAERLSVNARRLVEQFDWSVVLPQWESVLTEVADRSSSVVRGAEK